MSNLFEYRRRIHWGDTDAAQIAYTGKFLQFAMEAMEGWFIHTFGLTWFEISTERGYGNPVVNCSLDFINPLTPKHELICTVLIEKVGRSSFTYKVLGKRSDGIESFSASITAVWINCDTFKPVSIPPEYRDKIEAYAGICRDMQ